MFTEDLLQILKLICKKTLVEDLLQIKDATKCVKILTTGEYKAKYFRNVYESS